MGNKENVPQHAINFEIPTPIKQLMEELAITA